MGTANMWLISGFYNNFISAGYGNYSTPIIEIFAHSNSSNYNDFGGFFNYHSSGGGIDGLVLNDGEARMLTGEQNLIRAGAALQMMGPKYVIIKKGEHGAFLFTPDERFGLLAYPVDSVVDPTGAGDSFAGGMMGALAAEGSLTPKSIHRAMAYGTVCASFTVQDFSVRALEQVTRSEIDARFAELGDFLSFSPVFSCP